MHEVMRIDPQQTIARLVEFIRSQISRFEREGAILGMSGGIDSAVVGSLLCRALGPEKVLALLLPERDSSPDSKNDALLEIERLGIAWREVNLEPMLAALGIYKLMPLHFLGTRQIKETLVNQAHRAQGELLGEMPFRAGLLGTRRLGGAQKQVLNAGNAYSRVKHRARMLALYYYADLENRLVAGTTNRAEAMTGFVVKWGDNVADIEPIVRLYKTQVRQLAAALGVTQKIIDKAPTPDLMPGIVDEAALGIDYTTLDLVLYGLEHGWDDARIQAESGAGREGFEHVREMMRRSEHLRSLPPSVDFGF